MKCDWDYAIVISMTITSQAIKNKLLEIVYLHHSQKKRHDN